MVPQINLFPPIREKERRRQFGLVDQMGVFTPAGSHSDQWYCCGYSHWHFLLAGTLKTLLWPLHFLLFSTSFSISFLLSPELSLCSPSFLCRCAKYRSLPLIFFFLCLSLSLSRQPHFLPAVLITASLSSLVQHPPTTFSASLLPPHSVFFLSEPLSPYLSFLPAFLLLLAFETLPLLVFHFTLIHNKTKVNSERDWRQSFFFSCIILNLQHRPFSFLLLSKHLSRSTCAK